MAEKKVQRRIWIPEGLDSRLQAEADRTGTEVSKVLRTAAEYYLSRDEGLKEMWLGKFQRLNAALEADELRIRGITSMLLYFVQTFLYAHPEVNAGFADDAAYAEATRMCREWLSRSVESMEATNRDFVSELKGALSRDGERKRGAK